MILTHLVLCMCLPETPLYTCWVTHKPCGMRFLFFFFFFSFILQHSLVLMYVPVTQRCMGPQRSSELCPALCPLPALLSFNLLQHCTSTSAQPGSKPSAPGRLLYHSGLMCLFCVSISVVDRWVWLSGRARLAWARFWVQSSTTRNVYYTFKTFKTFDNTLHK